MYSLENSRPSAFGLQPAIFSGTPRNFEAVKFYILSGTRRNVRHCAKKQSVIKIVLKKPKKVL